MPQHRKLKIDELNRLSVEEFKATEKTPVVVVLDNVRSLHNVGSVFRTCDALRIGKLVLTGITSTPPSAEIHKTALGAEFSVDWQYFADTLDAVAELRRQGYTVCSIEQAEGSVSLPDFVPAEGQAYALIFGNEVKGVRQDVVDASDMCIEIPQYGTKHSFNVSVTAGIVLWDIFKHLEFGR